MTNEDFINKSKSKFGEKFDYSETVYEDYRKEVTIICRKHGKFKQKPNVHLMSKHGCPYCAKENTILKKSRSFKSFIDEMKLKGYYNDNYVYYEDSFVNMHTDMNILCPTHGIFKKTPKELLNGCICPICSKEKHNKCKITPYNVFLKKAKEKYGDKFLYNESSYKKMTQVMQIFCPKHGWFKITPFDFLQTKHGCPECGIHNSYSLDEIIKKGYEINGDKYEYLDYDAKTNLITIYCKKHKLIFKQTTFCHFNRKQQCPICARQTYSLEYEMKKMLTENNIVFEEQKTFDWLKNKHSLFLDFFIPSKNIAIECQGGQHFNPIKTWGGEKVFKQIIQRDVMKRKLCEDHGIKLLYYSNLHINYPYEVIEDLMKILEKIQNV